jgi:starch phosphorylase
MWSSLYPGVNDDRVPIGHITNGVHVKTWLAPQMRQVYDRHLGPDWSLRAGDENLWDKIDDIDDAELWETHQTLKVQLIEIARRHAGRRAARRLPSFHQMRRALSFDALTMGSPGASPPTSGRTPQDMEPSALVNNP